MLSLILVAEDQRVCRHASEYHVDISTIFQEADGALFHTILSNKSHVIYTYLSEWPEIAY